MKTIFSIIVFCINCFIPFSIQANNYIIDGFDVDIMWDVKKDEFKVWGDVENGKHCDQLSLFVKFENIKDNRKQTFLIDTIGKHTPKSRSIFKESKKRDYSKYRNYWKLVNYKIHCLQ